MKDYNGTPLKIGDTIKNIESGWRGVTQSAEGEGIDTMLCCKGVNWWTGELDEDDVQWHNVYDVIKQPTQAPQPSEAPSTTNFL